MMAIEAAWSRHGHLAGLWTKDEGAAAYVVIKSTEVSPSDLLVGTKRDGVCVPALVELLKVQTGSNAIHKDATSQDVIDTATVISIYTTASAQAAPINVALS